jgi:hypothetical protein
MPPSAREQGQQAEAARGKSGMAQIQPETIHVITGRHTVHEQLDAEAAGVGDEQHPHAVITCSGDEHAPAAGLARLGEHAHRAQFAVIAIRAILAITPIQRGDDQHRHTRHEHRRAPTQALLHTQRDHGSQHPRHHRLRHAAAGVTPAGRGGIGGADHVRREHHRGVVLRNDETRAGDADGQAKEQKRCIAVRKGDAEHRNRTQHQQPCVRAPRPEAIAQRPDDQPSKHGDRHRGDADVGELVLAEMELALDQRHQRRHREPGEKADEERQPAQMERPHLWRAQLE